MKILTQSEVLGHAFKQFSNRQANPLTKEARRVAVGQSVLITKEEWPNKSVPSLSSKIQNIKFSSRTLADGSGWVFTRIV